MALSLVSDARLSIRFTSVCFFKFHVCVQQHIGKSFLLKQHFQSLLLKVLASDVKNEMAIHLRLGCAICLFRFTSLITIGRCVVQSVIHWENVALIYRPIATEFEKNKLERHECWRKWNTIDLKRKRKTDPISRHFLSRRAKRSDK